jgi:hypothetical protein
VGIAEPVKSAIAARAAPGVTFRSFKAVKSTDPSLEQLYFISATVRRGGVATWAADSIDTVRSGPCADFADCDARRSQLQPIILNANAAARAATPSLRPNDTPEVPRPGGNRREARRSRECVR